MNRRFEAIRANRSHVMKLGFFFFLRIDSRESICADRPDSRCESPGHLSNIILTCFENFDRESLARHVQECLMANSRKCSGKCFRSAFGDPQKVPQKVLGSALSRVRLLILSQGQALSGALSGAHSISRALSSESIVGEFP